MYIPFVDRLGDGKTAFSVQAGPAYFDQVIPSLAATAGEGRLLSFESSSVWFRGVGVD